MVFCRRLSPVKTLCGRDIRTFCGRVLDSVSVLRNKIISGPTKFIYSTS